MNLQDGIFGRNVRISEERWSHILSNHPEMEGQYLKLKETLLNPDRIVSSNSDPSVNLYYRKYSTELVGEKYLCMVIKTKETDVFMLTAYFTDAIKKGDEIWKNI